MGGASMIPQVGTIKLGDPVIKSSEDGEKGGGNVPVSKNSAPVLVGDGGKGNTTKPQFTTITANGVTKSVTFGENIDNIQRQWDSENQPVELPPWLSHSLQQKEKVNDADSGFGSDLS